MDSAVDVIDLQQFSVEGWAGVPVIVCRGAESGSGRPTTEVSEKRCFLAESGCVGNNLNLNHKIC